MVGMPSSTVTPRRVCVVGAGPVGALAAVSWARSGAEVSLLEARPGTVRRLGGEWLHPAAVSILKRAGVLQRVLRHDHARGLGFVVFPEDGSAPIELAYGGGRCGITIEHAALVEALREAAVAEPAVTYMPHARLTEVRGTTVDYVDAAGRAGRLEADLIVGADGRSSRVRQAMADPRGPRRAGRKRFVSCMAGVILPIDELPAEGFGHVLVGGPGPVLAYRIGPGRVRLCLDVPARYCGRDDLADLLVQEYAAILPRPWRRPFKEACATGAVVWARNEVAARDLYGAGTVRLVGDAVGSTHPLTAVGMTLGFQDAAALVGDPQLAAYRRTRHTACRVPQSLSADLYAALSGVDGANARTRQAIYRRWRESEAYRRDTVRLLAAEETSMWTYRRVSLRVSAAVVQGMLRGLVAPAALKRPA